MGATVLAVVQGNAPGARAANGFHDSVSTGVPILLFMALVLLAGPLHPAARWSRCCARPPRSWR